MIELIIDQRRKDLGGFEVGRVLPWAKRRTVGPFVFFDHMSPADFAPGLPRSVDVRPHPHIGLSTVTYLFEGEIMHRDSVGSVQPIRAGEVNWVTAGRGVTIPSASRRAASGATGCTASRPGRPCPRLTRRWRPRSATTASRTCRATRSAACPPG